MRRVFLLVTLVLAGCASHPPLTEEYPIRWRQHAEAVRTWQSWELQGRVAVQIGEEGWHASLLWQQFPEHYLIQLSGPFGQGGIRLEGDAAQVRFVQGKRVAVAQDAEALMQQELGWSLPVNGLQRWVLGLPQDERTAVPAFDAEGQLARLQEAGWELEYQRYAPQGKVYLPVRLRLQSGDLKVRLVVDRWQRTEVGGDV